MPTGGGIGDSTGRSVGTGDGTLGAVDDDDVGEADGERVVAEAVDDETNELGSGAEGRLVGGRIDAATSVAMKSRATTSRETSADERAREAGIEPTVARSVGADPGPKVPAPSRGGVRHAISLAERRGKRAVFGGGTGGVRLRRRSPVS